MEASSADDVLRLPLLIPSNDATQGSSSSTAAPPPCGASLQQTTFNLVNIFVGLGLLSMPYALARGGWAGLAALALLVPLFGASGQLICAAFELMEPGTRKSYVALGTAAGGALGRRTVLAFATAELFGATVVTLLICWEMLALLLPTQGLGLLNPTQLAACISTVVLLPLLFIDLRRLSRFSMLGSCATCTVVALVLSLAALDPSRAAMPQQPPPGRHALSPGLIQALGIFALSCSAHTTLPALRSSMHNKSQFPAALAIGFAIMFACYSAVATAGYWYFGDAASPLVITDLAINSFFTQSAGIPVDRLLAVLVLVSGLTKYPALNMCLQDMLLSAAPSLRVQRAPRPWLVRSLRVALFAAAALLALTVYSSLGSVLSLVGGLCSLTCSLLLPSAFYTRLAWPRLRWPARLALCALVVLSLGLIGLVTATNLAELVGSHRQGAGPGSAEGSSWSGLVGLLPFAA